MIKNTKNTEIELFEHNTEDLKIWFTSTNNGKDLELVKFRGYVYTPVSDVLDFVRENSNIEIRYVGRTVYQSRPVYLINGRLYQMVDGWFCNDETRGTFVECKMKSMYPTFVSEKAKVLVSD